MLAFDNLSNDPEMQFFSDGVSEEILQRLSRGARLRVIARTSSFQLHPPGSRRSPDHETIRPEAARYSVRWRARGVMRRAELAAGWLRIARAAGATLAAGGLTGAPGASAVPQEDLILAHQKISDTLGGLAEDMDAGDAFGSAVASASDLDGDGHGDLIAAPPATTTAAAATARCTCCCTRTAASGASR